MEDRTMIIVGVVVLIIVLFVLLIIPATNRDILGSLGSDEINLNTGNASPSAAPVPTITELQGQDLKVGTGSAEVTQGDTVTIHYIGYFLDSSKFYSSYENNEPFTFTVGAQQTIPGIEQGVVNMKQGGQRRLFIPSNLAYGEKGNNAIPPNTPVAFDIELLSIGVVESPTPEPTTEPEESQTPESEN